MADTNVNLLINLKAAKSSPSLRADYFSRKTYNLNYKNTGSFDNVFDRITAQPARNSAPEPSSTPNRTSDYSRQTSRPTERTTSNRSTTSKPDNAPDDFEAVDDFDEEIDDKPSASSNAPVDAPIMFTMSTESLLAVRDVPLDEEPVMMTVLPQQSNSQNQSMLNMLAGNTWRAIEPTTAAPEVIPTEELIAPTAPVLEGEEIQPLNLEPQTIVDPRATQPIAVVDVENAPVEVNQMQAPAPVSVEQLAQPLEQISVEAPVELPIDNAPTIQSRSEAAQPLSNIPLQASNVESQPIVEQTDASSQAQVISNDATLSNIVDAAKNSQPKIVTDDIAPTAPAFDEAPTPVIDQPTANVAPTLNQPTATGAQSTAPLDQPRPIDPQQPVQTQQSIETAPTTIVEPQSINQQSIAQSVAPTVEQPTLNQPTIAQPVEQPTTVIDQPTAPIETATPTVEQPTLNQPTTAQSIAQPLEAQSTVQPSPTQQIFDEVNAAPRGADEIAQPTLDAQANANRPAEADVEPVHRRYHGQAAQQAVNAESAWTNRPAPLYQLAQQQASNVTGQASTPINNATAAPTTAGNVLEAAAPASTAAANISAIAPQATAQKILEAAPNLTAPAQPTANNQPTAPSINNQPALNAAQPSAPAQSTTAPSINNATAPNPTAAPSMNTEQQAGRASTSAQPSNAAQPSAQSFAAPSINNVAAPQSAPTENIAAAQPAFNAAQPSAPAQSFAAPAMNNAAAPTTTFDAAQPSAPAQSTAPAINNAAAPTTTFDTAQPSAPAQSFAAPSMNNAAASTTFDAAQPSAPVQPSFAPSMNDATTRSTAPAQSFAAPSINNAAAPTTTFDAAQPSAPAQSQSAAPAINNVAAPAQAAKAAENISAAPMQTAAAAQNILAATPKAAAPTSNDTPTANQSQPSANQNILSAAPALTASAVQNIAATAQQSAAHSSVDQQATNNAAAQPSAPSTNNATAQPSNAAQPFTIPTMNNPATASNPTANPQSTAPFSINAAPMQTAPAAQNILQSMPTAPMFEGQGAPMPGGESFNQNFGTAINNLNTPQPTAQAQPSTPNTAFAQQLRDDFNIAGQIVENARMIRTAQNTEMIIHLKPEHLGELTLRVSVTAEGTVNASFHSDNAAVRAIIENSLVNLKQELANQGLKVDNVEVYSGLADGGSLMNGKGRQAWQQGRRNAQRVDRVRGANRNDGGAQAGAQPAAQSVDIAQPVENIASDGGVDYKV